MNRSITLSLKKSKLTKRYYANPTDFNKEILLHQVSECTKLIFEAKDKHLAKLSSKNQHQKHIGLKIPIIPPVFFESKLISDFEKKAEPFNNHLPHNALWSKMQVPYQILNIKPMYD